jgi:3alpha(or 20beta)-hydroxysteroid dehydrogenase
MDRLRGKVKLISGGTRGQGAAEARLFVRESARVVIGDVLEQLGCFLGMKAVVPSMEQSGGGSIANISSVAGLRGSPGAITYSATKWALRGMIKAAAIDLAPRQIRMNSVHPGPIDTEMLKIRTSEQNQLRLQSAPMKRMRTGEEVAHLVLFLLSDESSYITGAEIAIDGGAKL